MIIEVTQEHIDKALAYNRIRAAYAHETDLDTPKELWTSFSCPIALAATDASGKAAQVDGSTVSFNIIDNRKLPEEAQAFVSAFDLGETVEPFSFELVM
jgi:hypothetical protein